MRFVIVILMLLMVPMTTLAQDLSRIDLSRIERIETAWGHWLDLNKVDKASLTISYKGRILHSISRNIPDGQAMPIASLSKGITAACITHLISVDKLELDTTLKQIFGNGLTGLGAEGLHGQGITISQLLSHSSGLMPDSTQEAMWRWQGNTKQRHHEVTITALSRSTQMGKLGVYAYNNENYAILGEVIKSITGQRYGDYCKSVVLDPLGIKTATLQNKWGAFGPWGGWEISSDDYARFVSGYFGDQSSVGNDPLGWAKVAVNKGVFYGMGSFFRNTAKFRSFWNFGLLCFTSGDSAGSYFATWQGKWQVVVTYDACPSWKALRALDVALGIAAVH